MESPLFLAFLSAAFFISIVLLAVVCLDCRRKGPLAYIRETNPSDEYINPPTLTVMHPFAVQPTTDLRSIRSPSNLLSPVSPSTDSGVHWRHRSATPTETESNPSYENPVQDGPIDSDVEDPGYIVVLPDDAASPSVNQSRASTPSLDQHDYENFPEQAAKEDRDYQNVELQHFQNTDDDDDDDDSDDEANYVNQPPMIHSA
ncbi:hypothetical protein EXN66_Car015385 [Channa argus]|uniref:Uncharacterized protein n=1 Tax=Channa argus TaxID=215402 RepID=A0A6G1QBQ1_CHAAH|nr:hypothetical protein EXN66_Car015385 [Channa argus]